MARALDAPGRFEEPLEGAGSESSARLIAERLRDGRIALAVHGGVPEGTEMHVLAPEAALAFAAWLTPLVERAWLPSVRHRAETQLALAEQIHGEERGGARLLAAQILDEVPPRLLVRALVLLANSIGPLEHTRKVRALNRTTDLSDDLRLRQMLAEETGAFGYVLAAAALLDALDPDAPEFESASG